MDVKFFEVGAHFPLLYDVFARSCRKNPYFALAVIEHDVVSAQSIVCDGIHTGLDVPGTNVSLHEWLKTTEPGKRFVQRCIDNAINKSLRHNLDNDSIDHILELLQP